MEMVGNKFILNILLIIAIRARYDGIKYPLEYDKEMRYMAE